MKVLCLVLVISCFPLLICQMSFWSFFCLFRMGHFVSFNKNKYYLHTEALDLRLTGLSDTLLPYYPCTFSLCARLGE